MSYWIISAIIAPGSTLSTAKGKETKSANTQASASLFPGSRSLKQITSSAAENTMQPSIMGSFLPRFFIMGILLPSLCLLLSEQAAMRGSVTASIMCPIAFISPIIVSTPRTIRPCGMRAGSPEALEG